MVLDSGECTEPAKSLYSVTGTSFNTAIGRVAFVLGLGGPALALNTACSSSLVAIHQAVSGLQREEADMALAGGVHAILSGRLLALRANAGMLSPDGRCATFDAAANGYVRGEGCGILVLKRLGQAEADGDRIWCVIRGSAVNQNGATAGPTVPNGPAREQVIEDALSNAGVSPAEVDYLEAHGTASELGDPIEVQAAANVYGSGREPDRPLLIGSVKTNIGHLEAAAGVAGLVKAVLAMRRGVIPRNLHFRNPNPHLDWLAEQAGEPGFGDAAGPVLSDMAWTAGIGRSHYFVPETTGGVSTRLSHPRQTPGRTLFVPQVESSQQRKW